MTNLVRYALVCLTFFIVLSITVSNKTIFQHIYSLTSYVTIPAQNLTMSLFDKAAESTTAYTRKLFQNSVPKVKDSVKTKAAGLQRKAAAAEPEEVILEDEKEELDELIKTHH